MRGRIGQALAVFGRWGVAHALIRCEEYAFDYLLYPFMLYRGGQVVLVTVSGLFGIHEPLPAASGYWAGFALLTMASVGINLLYIRLYDGWRTDWFGFEALKATVRFATADGRRPIWRRALRYGAFLYLSIWHSPLFGTLFLRDADSAYVMTRRDWVVFWIALLLANLGWATLVSGVVEAGKAALTMLHP